MSAELRCTMPVVREDHEDDSLNVEACGEPLAVEWGEHQFLDEDGPADSIRIWKVACHQGHVLVCPDMQGNDREIPLEWKVVRAALTPFIRGQAVVGQWWIKTDFGGEKIAGPFTNADDAFTARHGIERRSGGQTFAVEAEGEL